MILIDIMVNTSLAGQLVSMAANGNHYLISPDGSVLTVEIVDQGDFGTYECVAENPSGRNSAAAQLILRPTG